MEPYLTDNVPDATITIPGKVLTCWQDRPSRGGSIVVYNQEGVILRVLNIDSRPQEVSCLHVKNGQGNLLFLQLMLSLYVLLMFVWVSSRCSTFLPESKDVQ
eukprot:g35839.t1